MEQPLLPPFIADRLPKSDVSQAALKDAWRTLREPIFNHSLRTFVFAKWLLDKEDALSSNDPNHLDVLFTACIYHDIGTCDEHNGSQRFEVEGADVAKNHLLSHGFSEQDSHQAWIAIAIHTSPGIAERIFPLSRTVRLGVLLDFSKATRDQFGANEFAAEVEQHLPRLEIEKVLADAVVHQADLQNLECPDNKTYPNPEKHPKASWPGILLRAHLQNPDHEGVNLAF